jgi:hypothetical protein
LQLRLYQTLVEVSGEAATTIVFPVPIDLISAGGASPMQLQSMMQSAAALATSQQTAKQLAASGEKVEADGSESRLAAGLPRR